MYVPYTLHCKPARRKKNHIQFYLRNVAQTLIFYDENKSRSQATLEFYCAKIFQKKRGILYVQISRALALLTLYLIHVGRARKAVPFESINGRDLDVEEPIRGDPIEVNRPVVAPWNMSV